MKRTVPLAIILLTGAAYKANAEQPGPDWIPMNQALRKLGDTGYGEIRSLEADNGRWEAKAVKDGKPVAVLVDPRSGTVTEETMAGKGDEKKDEDYDD